MIIIYNLLKLIYTAVSLVLAIIKIIFYGAIFQILLIGISIIMFSLKILLIKIKKRC